MEAWPLQLEFKLWQSDTNIIYINNCCRSNTRVPLLTAEGLATQTSGYRQSCETPSCSSCLGENQMRTLTLVTLSGFSSLCRGFQALVWHQQRVLSQSSRNRVRPPTRPSLQHQESQEMPECVGLAKSGGPPVCRIQMVASHWRGAFEVSSSHMHSGLGARLPNKSPKR